MTMVVGSHRWEEGFISLEKKEKSNQGENLYNEI
jgi:hypothetical protein